MNATLLTVQKARTLAAHLRTSRRAAPTWDVPVDRDVARQARDLTYMAQATAPRVL